MVRLWIELFNRGGIDALATKPRRGRKRRLKLERLRDLLVPVLENPAQAGELHWTGVKLHGWLKESLGLELGYSTTVRYLHELGYKSAGATTLAGTTKPGGSGGFPGAPAGLAARCGHPTQVC